MPNYTIGVDLGGTNLRIAAVDETGQLKEKVTLGTQVSLGRDHVVNEMCDAIRQVSQRHKSEGELKGIGIGVPGIIDMHTGMVRQSPNLPDWVDYPAQAVIEKQLGTRVFLENDANAAALGEKWLGAAKDYDDMAMYTLGTGVGGGIVLGGKILHGMTGMAGELGHMTIEPDGHPCKCGNHGCLEQYASATAVVRMAKEAIAAGATALAKAANNDPEFSSKAVYNLAIQGDQDAKRIFHAVGRALGIAISGMVNALNLPMYVIGGGVSSAWDAFAPTIFEELRWRCMVYKATDPETVTRGEDKTLITRALLGGDAGLYGAARLPMVH
ncbi:MAG TPA: ROK family protein [Terriglobales bacterium]